ncbi:MAG: ATP phosphoribosyltransferase regulatory subunit, partial [Muribaculaceae bacterium]|nr:ATP phosphoribosyltransferase regulatory subunit [Muribaculaceae bacterium]
GINNVGLHASLDLDVSLARGLNYYTGTIIEVKANDVEIGSITGGGRYDNLTGIFGLPNVSGVGISFGADRIYDVLNALDLYPAEIASATRLLFINFGEKEAAFAMKCLAKVREADIPAEIYPDSAKMKKQMEYANDICVPFVAIIGEDELSRGGMTLKNMATGEQQFLTIEEVIKAVKE